MNEAWNLTHKGIFGLCPVYIRDITVTGEDVGIYVVPRHWILEPLFQLSEAPIIAAMHLTRNYVWPLTVSGELRDPRTYTP